MMTRVFLAGRILALLIIWSFPGACEEVRYVSFFTGSDFSGDGSMKRPWMTIQHAIDQITDATSSTPYAIHVASGTYTSNKYNVVSMRPYVDLLGGYEPASWSRDITSNTTVIDGENARPCVEMTSYCTLDGFTVSHGKYSGCAAGISFEEFIHSVTVSNCSISRNNSGGVYCGYYSSPVLSNCIITQNTGRGVYCSISSAILTNCTITNNITTSGGGGVACEINSPLGPPTFINCAITDNKSKYGGGVACYNCSPILTNWSISSNVVLGYYDYYWEKWNGGEGGGIYYGGTDNSYSSVKLTNCTIVSNTAHFGGGLYCDSTFSPVLTNCTIADNSADFIGGVFNLKSSTTMLNCILWNHGDEIISGTITINNSCIQEIYTGKDNINNPPKFVNPLGGNFRLKNGSPCINRGTSTGAPATDIEGNTRPMGDGVDMGAYEAPAEYFQGSTNNAYAIYVRSDALKEGDGLSWSTALQMISEAFWVSSPTSEIWVAAGRYKEAIKLERNVFLYKGFLGDETSIDQRDWSANPTIIDATIINTYTVFSENSLLDGFIITGGQYAGVLGSPILSNCSITGNRGVGIYGSPTLNNCIITANQGNGVDKATSFL